MAHARSLIAPLSRLTTSSIAASQAEIPRFVSLPYQSIRCATTKAQPKKKKKARNTFIQYDLRRAEQFPLIDAMQYVYRIATGRAETDCWAVTFALLKSAAIHPRPSMMWQFAYAPSKTVLSFEVAYDCPTP
jgi:hypothetical protein